MRSTLYGVLIFWLTKQVLLPAGAFPKNEIVFLMSLNKLRSYGYDFHHIHFGRFVYGHCVSDDDAAFALGFQ